MRKHERCEAQECMNGPWLPARFVRYNDHDTPTVTMGGFWEKPVRAVRPVSAVAELGRILARPEPLPFPWARR